MPGVKRKPGFDVDRLGTWYTPGRSTKRNAIDQVTKIMAPRSGVTGSEARDKIMAKTLSKAPKVGNRLFSTKRPYKPRRKKGGYIDVATVKANAQRGYIPGLARPENTFKNGIDPADDTFIANGYIKNPQGKWVKKLSNNFHAVSKNDDFWGDLWGGFKKGFNGVKSVAEQIPFLKEAAAYMPSIGDDNPEEGDGIRKVHRKLPQQETTIRNIRGTGMHKPVPDIKLDPELAKSVSMMQNTPLDKDASNSLSNLPQAQVNHLNNLKRRRVVPGLIPRRKLTKGGRTFTTLRNILVTPDAAP